MHPHRVLRVNETYSGILLQMHLNLEIEQHEEKMVAVAFRIGMWWRILYGSLRLILGGIMLKFFIGTPFSELLFRALSHEVVEDPTDIFFQFLYFIFENHSFTVTYFVASYLIFWGIIDIILSLCLLKHQLWSFPVSIGLIGLFVFYSVYRFFHTHSLILLGIIFVDIVIVYIIYKEYRVLQTERGIKAI